MKGLQVKQNRNGFTAIRLHYTADPDKDPEQKGMDWFRRAKKGTPLKDWEQEYEINFNVYKGEAVFPGFDYERHVNPNVWATKDVSHPINVCLDFGYRHPAVVVAQYDGMILRIVGEWTPLNIKTEDYAREIRYQMGVYEKDRFSIRYLAGFEAKRIEEQTAESAMDVFGNLGVDLEITEDRNINRGLDIIRILLAQDRILINARCTRLIDAMQGGYRYPEWREDGANPKRMPVKDGVHDDIIDAFRYGIVQTFRENGEYMFTEREDRLLMEGLGWHDSMQPGHTLNHPVTNTGQKPICESTGY